MRKRFHKGFVGLLAALLVLGAAGSALLLLLRPSVEYLPTPMVKDLGEFATLEWEPKEVPRQAFERDPQWHPGHRLAVIHCRRCHLLPSPNQLPRDAWPFVLTWMSNYLGYTNIYGPFSNNVDGSLVPDSRLVSESELQNIAEYYLLYSPVESRTPIDDQPPKDPDRRFEPVTMFPEVPPAELITLVHFDDINRRFYIGRGTAKVLHVYDADGRILLTKTADSEPVDVEPMPGGFRMSVLGDFIEDKRRGEVVDVRVDENGELQARKIIENHHRLTRTHSVDLNQDGTLDLLLVGFGAGVVGKVSISWIGRDGAVSGEEVLIDYAGAVNAEVHDFNGDGLPDIMVLTSQERQELLLFLNLGGGRFREQTISKQFAGFGYNQFSLHDFDQDGLMDLVLVNGNNMEIKNAPVKPYHGVRIFRNEGDLSFTEKFFYSMPGAIKAVAEDFDLDGDLDMAAISFCPDWAAEPPETFVYLENQGDYRFRAKVPPNEHWGRWITMTSGDVNGDGYADIVLGGGYVDHGVHLDYLDAYKKRSRDKPSVVVLKNKGPGG